MGIEGVGLEGLRVEVGEMVPGLFLWESQIRFRTSSNSQYLQYSYMNNHSSSDLGVVVRPCEIIHTLFVAHKLSYTKPAAQLSCSLIHVA